MPTDLSTATLLAMPEADIPKSLHPALVVLSAPTLQAFPRVIRFVDIERGDFNWPEAVNTTERWSSSEKSLVAIASALWGRNPCDIHEALMLDDANMHRVILALEVYREWRTLHDALTEAARYDATQ